MCINTPHEQCVCVSACMLVEGKKWREVHGRRKRFPSQSDFLLLSSVTHTHTHTPFPHE